MALVYKYPSLLPYAIQNFGNDEFHDAGNSGWSGNKQYELNSDRVRFHPELPHLYRTPYQRDRDRVIHSKAFRRLGYKTQVFVNSEGDMYRSRLTHSLEVAQISRSVSFALGLNQDFSETLALAHDLGHPPFGHAGQTVLNDMMKNHGGFEHNCQGLRQLTSLETRYIGFAGLNLTKASLIGMMKHARVYDCDTDLLPLVIERKKRPPILEALLVDFCDRIAYTHHDLEDGLASKLITLDDLEKMVWWKEAWVAVSERTKEDFEKAREAIRIRTVIHHMLDTSIENTISTSWQKLKNCKTIWSTQKSPIGVDDVFYARLEKLQKFLYQNLYRHPHVLNMSDNAIMVIQGLFSYFMKSSEKMPEHYQKRMDEDGLERTVCDYIAGMTDRFAQDQYKAILD